MQNGRLLKNVCRICEGLIFCREDHGDREGESDLIREDVQDHELEKCTAKVTECFRSYGVFERGKQYHSLVDRVFTETKLEKRIVS